MANISEGMTFSSADFTRPSASSRCHFLHAARAARISPARPAPLWRRSGFKRAFGQQSFAVVHMQPHPMQLRRRDIPPALDGGGKHQLRNQIAPDERLLARGNQEILFGFGQRIGQSWRASRPAFHRRWMASRCRTTSVDFQVWLVPGMPMKSWLRTNSGLV